MKKLKETKKPTIILTDRDMETFINELMNPSPPNEAAIKAVKRYRLLVKCCL